VGNRPRYEHYDTAAGRVRYGRAMAGAIRTRPKRTRPKRTRPIRVAGLTRQQRWNRRNRATLNESQAWYRAKRLDCIPLWAYSERDGMRQLYRDALDRRMEVDHIVPLEDPDVCGLHCLANMRLLPREDNRRRAMMTWVELNGEVPF